MWNSDTNLLHGDTNMSLRVAVWPIAEWRRFRPPCRPDYKLTVVFNRLAVPPAFSGASSTFGQPDCNLVLY